MIYSLARYWSVVGYLTDRTNKNFIRSTALLPRKIGLSSICSSVFFTNLPCLTGRQRKQLSQKHSSKYANLQDENFSVLVRKEVSRLRIRHAGLSKDDYSNNNNNNNSDNRVKGKINKPNLWWGRGLGKLLYKITCFIIIIIVFDQSGKSKVAEIIDCLCGGWSF